MNPLPHISAREPERMRAFSAAVLLLAVLALSLTVLTTVMAGDKDGNDDKYDQLSFVFRVMGLSRLKKHAEPQKALKLLGSGLQRTGTQSTKAALTQLGYKVFHMEDINSNGLQTMNLYAHLSDIHLKRFVDKILSLGYNATLDGPNCFFTPRLAKMFPEAKVLHTTRPSNSCEEWYDSVHRLSNVFGTAMVFPLNTVVDFDFATEGYLINGFEFAVEYYPTQPYYLPWASKYKSFGAKHNASYIEACRTWNKRIFNGEIERHRILDYQVTQGWEPLAKFLDKPIPDVPFPHINDMETLEKVKPVLYFIMYGYPFILFGLLILVRKCVKVVDRVTLAKLLD